MKLRLSDDLALPLDAVTQTFGVLAVRGAGKSNTAAVMAEEMHRAGLPFVAVDPTGTWWGLRVGQGDVTGLPIPVFGGRHGDVPLEKAGGQLIADLVVDQRLSCVLDISEFSEGDKTRFLIDFAERLYRRNTDPLHLFLEEADDYAPQRPFREQARLLRAWENVVRRGRARGLGITLITQRSASLNKSVLTQVETLLVLRTTSPQDRKAIQGWVDYHGQSRELIDSLPSLESGEAWVWSPSWLKVTKRVRIRRRGTFDSAATPKDVKGKRPPATLAEIDLGTIRTQMAATIERAKADDPKELKKRIGELERELAKKPAAVAPTVERVEVSVLTAEDRNELANTANACRILERDVNALGRLIGSLIDRFTSVSGKPIPIHPPAPAPTDRPRVQPAVARHTTPVRRAAPASGNGQDHGLPGPERKLLTALAQHGRRARSALALLTNYAQSGGAFRNPLSRLRTAGYIEGMDPIEITEAGMAALGDWTPLPTGRDLLDHWLHQLPGPESKLLRTVADHWPNPIGRERLAEATGYEVTGGAFRNPLSRLRTLGLVEGISEVRANKELFQ